MRLYQSAYLKDVDKSKLSSIMTCLYVKVNLMRRPSQNLTKLQVSNYFGII